MKIIWSLSLLLTGFVSFGQTSYLDKGTGSGESLKLGAKAMDGLSENNVEAIWALCSPKAKMDTAAIEGIATLISEEYQANEGREPVMDLKNNVPNGSYERTFYQMNEDGSIVYLLQVKMSVVEENGRAVISTIKSLKGAAVHKYDRLIKVSPEEKETTAPKEKHIPKQRKTDEEEED
jgi:hypothetical protein